MTKRATRWGAYVHITDTLRQRVRTGTYPAGSRLPSEAALCREFSVTRNTVRRALSSLETERLIRARAAIGRFVCGPDEEASAEQVRTRYQRIAADLRARIEDGDFLPGDLLPGEVRIGKRYGVSRHTAQRALVELEKAGLVECVHGQGRFVRRKTSPDDPQASVDVR
ncbi:GntR family transcriptional regulator [Actinomadura sp. 9N407]|uniref:GntR family transcriptional regulator n=1 Tax=Actinomadura sp. 9N407 TaxID=3375154 RepID=UPI0037B56F14